MTETIITGSKTIEQINAFLSRPLLARLSTAVPSRDDPNYWQPHNVPVWFYWDGVSLYISAFDSTRKVKEVQRNPFIAVLIDVAEAIEGVSGVLLEGKSELIKDAALVQEMSRVIYTRYMGEEGVLAPAPQSWIVDPENSIIRLTVKKIRSW